MTDYSAGSIEVLDGLDPVRKRPGMYTHTENPNHIAAEVIDNGVDEALAGHAQRLDVKVYEDGSISVQDDGRGMPIDIHPEFGITGVELILTRLHSGAKFNHDNYAFSGGLHGVGVSVVNALSHRVEVIIKRSNKCLRFDFLNGECKNIEDMPVSTLDRRGSFLRFWPDEQYFDSIEFDRQALIDSLHAKAMLCPNFAVTYHELDTEVKHTWCYESGMEDFLRQSVKGRELIIPDIITSHQVSDDAQAQWAIIWAEQGDLSQTSYVNLIPTVQGGTHVNGLRLGLFEAVKEFADIHGILPKNIRLKADDVCINLGFILSVKLQDAQFAGQTKQKLNSNRAQTLVQSWVKNQMVLWLNQNVKLGEALLENIIEQAKNRQRRAAQIDRKKAVAGPQLPGKLIDCASRSLSETELFLVEGDSAKGTVRQARDRINQAILPLRGKILNTWEVDSLEILKSQEIHDISVAIGLMPGQRSLEGLRYGKICILADADSDGHHIATLLCALFFKHFPELVRAGHLYVAMPPLYRIDLNKSVYYAATDAEKDELLKKNPNKKANVMRFKGLGEMSPEQLRVTTIKPGSRKLAQILLPEESQVRDVFNCLLAKKNVAERRSWIEDNADQIN